MEIVQTQCKPYSAKKTSILAVDAYPNTQNKLVSSSSSIAPPWSNKFVYLPLPETNIAPEKLVVRRLLSFGARPIFTGSAGFFGGYMSLTSTQIITWHQVTSPSLQAPPLNGSSNSSLARGRLRVQLSSEIIMKWSRTARNERKETKLKRNTSCFSCIQSWLINARDSHHGQNFKIPRSKGSWQKTTLYVPGALVHCVANG